MHRPSYITVYYTSLRSSLQRRALADVDYRFESILVEARPVAQAPRGRPEQIACGEVIPFGAFSGVWIPGSLRLQAQAWIGLISHHDRSFGGLSRVLRGVRVS
jgi:hypothetical protein